MAGIATPPNHLIMPLFLLLKEQRKVRRLWNHGRQNGGACICTKGFLGIESARSRFRYYRFAFQDSLESIKMWKENSAHRATSTKEKQNGIKRFRLEFCKVERHSF